MFIRNLETLKKLVSDIMQNSVLSKMKGVMVFINEAIVQECMRHILR